MCHIVSGDKNAITKIIDFITREVHLHVICMPAVIGNKHTAQVSLPVPKLHYCCSKSQVSASRLTGQTQPTASIHSDTTN